MYAVFCWMWDDVLSRNLGFRCQKETFPPFFALRGRGGTRSEKRQMLKSGAGKCAIRAFPGPGFLFLCAKNGISLLKEIFFLPQRRKFLAAKTSAGVWKAGKNGASDGLFFLIGDFPRTKSICLFASFPLHGLTRGRHLSARCPVAGGEVSRKAGFRLSSCIPATVRESRIFVRPRPCVRTCDSRGDGFDVLTK